MAQFKQKHVHENSNKITNYYQFSILKLGSQYLVKYLAFFDVKHHQIV